MNKPRITIIGSGLAGSFLAVLFAKRGYTVDIYERFSKEEIFDSNAKRSYNITFYGQGIAIIKQAGIWDIIKPQLYQLSGGSTQLSKYSKPILTSINNEKSNYFATSRSALIALLIQHAASFPHVTFHFNTALVAIDRYKKTMVVQNMQTQKIDTIATPVIIGADGTNSLVRPFMQQGQNTTHTQEYSHGGYRQFVITKEQVEKLELKNNIAYTWSAKNKFILAFPNRDKSLSALLIYPDNKDAFKTFHTTKIIKEFIANDFPLFLPIANDLAEQILANPTGIFATIHTDPWYYKDFITLVGDAAHGFYPFFGQGTSAAFADCMQLITLVDKYGPSWDTIFPLYQNDRKIHMDALGELSKKGIYRYARHKRADYSVIYETLESLAHSFIPKLIQAPIYRPVMSDPAHTAFHVEKHTRQRKIAKRLGIPVLVTAVTGCVALYESLNKTVKSLDKK